MGVCTVLLAVRGQLATVMLRGRPALAQAAMQALAIIIHAAVSTQNQTAIDSFIAPMRTAEQSSMPHVPIEHLLFDLLHFTLTVGAPASLASGTSRMDSASVLSRATVSYDDPSAIPVRSEATALLALQGLTEIARCKSTLLHAQLLAAGGLWYLLLNVLQGRPSDASK